MPDLSNLLGAVYGDGPSTSSRDPEDEAHVEREPAAHERGPAVPDWADDDHLDAAFAQWKPGPSEDAAPAEHDFANDTDDDPAPPLADDLAAALSEALVAASGTADDTSDPAGDKPRFDFSVPADEDESETDLDEEPIAAFAPKSVAPVPAIDPEPQNLSDLAFAAGKQDETEHATNIGEVEESEPVHVSVPESVAQVAPEPEPVHAIEPEPVHALEPEPEPVHALEPEPEPVHALEPEPVHAIEAEPVHAIEAEPEPETEPDAPEVDNWPTRTHRREAAAELSAASRVYSDPVDVTPAPTPVTDLEPLPASPMAAPEPVPARPTSAGDGATMPTTLPVGMRRWDRSDDDILPEKTSKKFFSFSLRRG